MISVHAVTKRWQNGTIALSNITLLANDGEIAVLIGPSGSGKSTLLRVIAGLEPYEQGTIEYPSGRVGMVFQEPSMWPHLSLLDNVALPLWKIDGVEKEKARQIASEVLVSWGLENRLKAYPSELSGGQQQRGALARTLVMKPKILCLDEITSSLDPEITAEILYRLLELKKIGTLILLVTHHLTFARESANQVIFMDNGHIIEHGTAHEILQNPQKKRTQDFIQAARL